MIDLPELQCLMVAYPKLMYMDKNYVFQTSLLHDYIAIYQLNEILVVIGRGAVLCYKLHAWIY